MNSWSDILLASENSKDFFRRAKERLLVQNPSFSFAQLAKKTGFSSRSLLWEVFTGRRAPSYKAFLKISAALALNQREKEFLKYLIVRDHPAFDRAISADRLPKLLTQAHSRLKAKARPLNQAPESHHIVENWLKVYAATGTESTPQRVSEITGLTQVKALQALDELSAIGLLEKHGKSFRSPQGHVTLDPQQHRRVIESFILGEIARLPAWFKDRTEKPDELAFGASFMIRKENLPRLKKHLMSELQRTVDLFLDEDGDSLVSLVGLALKDP